MGFIHQGLVVRFTRSETKFYLISINSQLVGLPWWRSG